MRQPMHVARRLAALPIVGVLALGFVGLFGTIAPIGATPPSASSPVPDTAFRPLAVPKSERPDNTATPNSRAHPAVRTGEPRRATSPDTATPIPTVKPTPPAGPTHVVRRGDTLWQIAAWHRVDLDAITRWSPDVDPRRLVAGQRILVPGGAKMPARPRAVSIRPATSDTKSTAPRATSTRRHVWPLPIRGTITRRFSSAHPATDIAAPSGTPVRAIAAGTVRWAGWKDNGGGFVVVIRHPDGMVSTYNHNRKVTVSRGQKVRAGQQIAAVGATGWATGPHLDLRIEMGGRFVNPLGLY